MFRRNSSPLSSESTSFMNVVLFSYLLYTAPVYTVKTTYKNTTWRYFPTQKSPTSATAFLHPLVLPMRIVLLWRRSWNISETILTGEGRKKKTRPSATLLTTNHMWVPVKRTRTSEVWVRRLSAWDVRIHGVVTVKTVLGTYRTENINY